MIKKKKTTVLQGEETMRVWKYAVSAAPEAPKTAPILFTGNLLCLSLHKAVARCFLLGFLCPLSYKSNNECLHQ